ncbi:LysM peptidoglycan-binding domain-containing protein [Demequina phytophila]|uniref:LysM peptidoglycan-binding domain-containing protein n=1 Tax=Demequina phytophila TaxID=1638981 RepID=UPI000783CC81|nr:LysM peptidoglycan-binding domain-containing protein [Demequina phytophila]
MSIYAPQTVEARARRTRAGRVVGVLVLLVGAGILGPQAFASDGAAEPVAVDVYAVGAGETLWDIAAARTEPGDDVRDTVADIQHLNAMADTALVAGQQLYVPVD